MKSSEEKSLRYVLRHYKPGTFDTRRAICKFELRRQGHTLHRTLLMWVLGVAAIALFVYGLYGWFSTAEKVEPWTQLTAANHTETYVLPDSSRVTLYPESTLRYQKGKFGRRERSVLVSGKAYFRVSPDPACPFRVTGRYGTVRVLGTAFEFDEMSREGETVVYVTEGRVAFAVKETFGGIFLYPGMAASLKDGAGMPEEMHRMYPILPHGRPERSSMRIRRWRKCSGNCPPTTASVSRPKIPARCSRRSLTSTKGWMAS